MSSPETSADVDSATDTEPSPQQRRLEAKWKRAAESGGPADTADDTASSDETVHLKVFRYDPGVAGKREPRFDGFYVPYGRGMTVPDALIYARDEFDSSLTFRHSCRMALWQ